MVRSPVIKNLARNQLCEEGFGKFWAPVERLGLLHTTAWDGATEGRLETMLKNTAHLNKKLVRNFFASPKPLEPLVAECSTSAHEHEMPPELRPNKHRLALLSRYRDNLYICLANVPDHESELVKMILASILKNVYGIPLKWENHSKDVTWGEACSEAFPLSLVRKGCAMSIHGDTPREWESWVSTSSPNARPVWNSIQFTLCSPPA